LVIRFILLKTETRHQNRGLNLVRYHSFYVFLLLCVIYCLYFIECYSGKSV